MKTKEKRGVLVLNRRVKEDTIITVPGQEPIRITVVRTEGDRVCLAFAAPRNVEVWRAELYDRIQKEGKRER